MEIDLNDKYALVAFQSDIPTHHDHDFTERVGANIWVSTKPIVHFDDHWREWLGSIRSEHFDSSNIFIVTKKTSVTPEVLDAENRDLERNAINFYLGLLLAGRFAYFEKPLLLTGSKTTKELSVRQLREFETPINFLGIDWDRIDPASLTLADKVATTLPKIWDRTERYKRLRRIFSIYLIARTTADILDRVHQYCRCIEGLIIPSPGDSGRKFRSRTELFIGPAHHKLMTQIYDFRSAIEHLNDHVVLTSRSRDDRAQIYKWAYIAEYVARDCLVRVLTNPNLWQYFETDEALKIFWQFEPEYRQQLWGAPIDPLMGLATFDMRSITNEDLGLR